MGIHALPCFGQSSKGKIHVNQHVKSLESLLTDPGEKHIKKPTKCHIGNFIGSHNWDGPQQPPTNQ